MKLIDEFKEALDRVAIGRTISEIFQELRENNTSRVSMMIVDSALKGCAISPLKNTLLLRDETFQKELQDTTKILNSIFDAQ